MRKEVKKNAMIKRLVFLCILVVLSTVLWGCGDVKKLSKEELKELTESAKLIDELSYKFTYKSDGREGNLKVIRKKKNFRIEMDISGELNTTIIIKDDYMYALDTEGKNAVKLSSGSEDLPISDLFDEINDFDWDSVDYIGVEKFKNYDCHVVLKDDGQNKGKVWLDAKTEFPVKIEIEGSNPVYMEV
ncbi:MAG TPA: DUF4412 domain-containing protein [Acetivibrio saccincola]|uniref:hypothetical protein n=1 Tax=Acetivibrio saccincola TaxID=1677857 RepID=UPI002B6E8D25|nr:hypothetical protein [Acetivibrio saccincola]HOA96727.1 DUF4412 domain-containing protein [Acetivibrio saccincola]HQD28075.1 DUF4412 domain-containing protein [Acetivibrio saccincola]